MFADAKERTFGGINMNISVVIPVYNSEQTLIALISRLQPVLEAEAAEYELILVNDGSSDQSWDVIRDLSATYSWLRGINFMRNYGQHNALLCGIRSARYEIIVTMDDDLQNPPEEIPKLLKKLDEGYDVVYGTPQKEQHGFWRDMASQITKLALKSTMGIQIARNVSAFRAFRSDIRSAFADYKGPFVSIDVLLTWGTTRFTAVPVRYDQRRKGLSNYNFRKLLTHTINMMTGFSTLPLRLASVVGFGFSLFGFGVLVYVVGRYLVQGSSVPGFAFTAAIISIFSGVQLFGLGIIGEYLARMHCRSMSRPYCVIRDMVGSISDSAKDK
jgi:glycosyltransferase involved in cell wall biosynthesis